MSKQKSRKFFRFSRIHTRLFVAIVGILGVCFAVICVAAQPVLLRVLEYRTGRNLQEIAEQIDALPVGSSTYYFALYSLSVNNNISLELISAADTISYQSAEGHSAQSSGHATATDSVTAEYAQTEFVSRYQFNGIQGEYERRRKTATNAEYLVYSRTLQTDETLHIYSPVAAIDSNVEVATRVFTLISVFICLVMVIFVFWYASLFTKPLVEMNDVTKDMASLKFGRRCKNYGNDEIGELGRSVNILSATLDSTLMDLREKNEQLERDIEHRAELDTARREFISNVSHELKTPIAIISGYAEGLCAGISDDPAVLQEYCRIIGEESQKMNSLVTELLELSKLESKNIEIKPEPYCIGEQIEDVLKHFSILFANHSVQLQNTVPKELMCLAQRDKIEIVLKNYISNAVSHCGGAMQIQVGCKDRGDRVRIHVFNTGDPIPKEDINKIWLSFYRADKSRERSENRFGLGLSIVQAIIKSHGTACGAENVKNGVLFWFEVKKD